MTKEQAATVLSCAISNLAPRNKASLRYHARIGASLGDNSKWRLAQLSRLACRCDIEIVPINELVATFLDLVEGARNAASPTVHGIEHNSSTTYSMAIDKLSDEEIFSVIRKSLGA